MIIRLTVNNNDFQELLVNYLSHFWLYIEVTDLTCDLITENVIEQVHLHNKINNMLNPNMNHKLTVDDKEFLIHQVKDSFAHWCKGHSSSADYLIEATKVTIQDSLTDQWENGEAAYWFQHSDNVVIQ